MADRSTHADMPQSPKLFCVPDTNCVGPISLYLRNDAR